jgi:hypothetical protein
MHDHLQVFTAIGLGLGLAVAVVQGAVAQQNPVTAIDIALEPDATMVQHAMDANTRLRKSFPKGFALDETHHPHISMLQQFVRTDDLDKVFAAANAVMAKEKPTAWTLKAFKYYYIPSPPLGLNPHVTIGVGTEAYLNKMLRSHSRLSRSRRLARQSISLAALARLERNSGR